MKMIMAILHKNDELETIEELNIAGYMVTKLATTGGFLKKKSTTIMMIMEKTTMRKPSRTRGSLSPPAMTK